MPRFVILTHDWPTLHWDFLAEAGDKLCAWRLLSEPTADQDIVAEPNTDHRLLYLDYEGPVSDGRGSVSRWDHGTCVWIENEADRVEIHLVGKELSGRVVLRRSGEVWSFRFTASVNLPELD